MSLQIKFAGTTATFVDGQWVCDDLQHQKIVNSLFKHVRLEYTSPKPIEDGARKLAVTLRGELLEDGKPLPPLKGFTVIGKKL